jgi:hypothetical protein
LFADRADAVAHLGPGVGGRIQPRLSVGFLVNDLAALNNRNRNAGRAAIDQRLGGDTINLGCRGGGKLRREGARGGTCNEDRGEKGSKRKVHDGTLL